MLSSFVPSSNLPPFRVARASHPARRIGDHIEHSTNLNRFACVAPTDDENYAHVLAGEREAKVASGLNSQGCVTGGREEGVSGRVGAYRDNS